MILKKFYDAQDRVTMFTGIVQAVGIVKSIDRDHFGARLLLDAADWNVRPQHGDSIAVNGVCLTYAPRAGDGNADADAAGLLAFDVVKQTLQCTTIGELCVGSRVNLESCLTPSSPMGGHFVQGHIDAVGSIERIISTDAESRMTVRVPASIMPCITPRGSITVDGVSLTLAAVHVRTHTFEVALIPTTLQRTTLGDRKEGDRVNIESDVLARAAVHYLQHYAADKESS